LVVQIARVTDQRLGGVLDEVEYEIRRIRGRRAWGHGPPIVGSRRRLPLLADGLAGAGDQQAELRLSGRHMADAVTTAGVLAMAVAPCVLVQAGLEPPGRHREGSSVAVRVRARQERGSRLSQAASPVRVRV